MDIHPDLLSGHALWLCHAVFWPLIALALWGAAWGDLARALRSHLYLGAMVAVLVLWQLRASTPAGPAVHMLGATLLTLLCGWRLALLGLGAVLAASTAAGAGGWESLGANGLICAALPVAVSHGVAVYARRRLPPNPFVYILVAGFAAGGLAMAAVGVASTVLLLAASGIERALLFDHYAVSYLLLVFPEAFLTGSVIAWLVMFYPRWVRTYRAPYPVHE